jgi:diaminohydroxyphosphoribosylaminopyrimidine deaminase/5-amino-6-(5-phosphoribosylamino)uracil reductase
VVLDSQLQTPLDSQLVQSAKGDVLVFCETDAPNERVAEFETLGIEVVKIAGHNGRLGPLDKVLEVLGERKILSVQLECGSGLNGAFLRQGLVDRVVLFYSGEKLGEGAIPFASGGGSPFVLEHQMHQLMRAMFGADVRVSGYLRNPWGETAAKLYSCDALG